MTITELYPFISRDKDKWPDLMAKLAHPMTALWPWLTVNRHLNFHCKFREHRKELFSAYESKDGIYHGPEKTNDSDSTSEEEDSMDDEFEQI